MTYTEAEAPRMFCPHMTFIPEWPGVYATQTVDPDSDSAKRRLGPFCVASRCSQWRWHHNNAGPPERRRGFCGLAGGIVFE